MNEKLSAHDEMEIIESIIYTFEGYALNDLQSSRLESSATGIMFIQVLDNLSGFLFKGAPRERIDQFISSYLSEYAELDLYDKLKSSLVYNYVVDTTSTRPSMDDDQEASQLATYDKLPMWEIIKDLKEGFELAFEDLRNNPKIRQLALEWYKGHKVYFWACSIYTAAQKKKLREYYLPLLKANSLFPGHKGGIDLYFSARKDQNYLIYVDIEDLRVVKDMVRIPLDLVIAWMGLRKVEEVLA